MKGLRNFIDKIKPNFEKGGKFENFIRRSMLSRRSCSYRIT